MNTVAKVLGNNTEAEVGNIGAALNDYYYPTGKACAELINNLSRTRARDSWLCSSYGCALWLDCPLEYWL